MAMFRWRLLVGVTLAGSLLGSAGSRAAEESRSGKRDGPTAAESPKRDAIADPLLLLLRAPVIRQELAFAESRSNRWSK